MFDKEDWYLGHPVDKISFVSANLHHHWAPWRRWTRLTICGCLSYDGGDLFCGIHTPNTYTHLVLAQNQQ